MTTSLYFSLLFLLFYFTETKSASCGGSVQKCIRCGCSPMVPQSQVQCDQTLKCDILNLTDTFVIACDEPDPDDCKEIGREDNFSCFSKVLYSETSNKWQFVTGYISNRQECDSVGCPPPGGFTIESEDQIKSQNFECKCFTNNCNRFRNVTVSVTTREMMTQTSWHSSLMPTHAHIGPSSILSHVVSQSASLVLETSLFNRSTTSEPAQSAEGKLLK